MPKPRYHQNISVTIKALGANGEGIGHWHGYTIFADKTLPGEEVRGRLIEKQKRYGRLQLHQLITRSDARVEAPCPYFERCGGCQLMHLDYTHQLQVKRQRVVDALKRFGHIEGVDVAPCAASPKPLAYRNKMQVPAAPDAQGHLSLGLYAPHSHELVDIGRCLVHCEEGDRVFQTCRALLQQAKITPYHFDTKTGELRYLLIKTAVFNPQVLVVLVTAGEASDPLKKVAREIIAHCPSVKGVVHNINSGEDNVVLGKSFNLLEGQAFIEETIHGLTFKVSAASFFQVNPYQADKLYHCAIEFAQLTGSETVLDAYCGVGTLTLMMADKAAKVIGIECVPEAIDDARDNARRNGWSHAQFICGEAESVISTLEKAEVILLNPPRKGCAPSFLEAVGRLHPRRIVYISCDPATLGRDLALLQSQGYAIDKVQPFDMFPQTAHVESVVQLTSVR